MPTPVSAVDAVSPAIERAKRMLFQPFRFGIWIRFAVLGFLTGEVGSGGGGGFNFSMPHLPSSSRSNEFLPAGWPHLAHLLPLIILAAVAFTLFMLVFMYLSSVLRFVLFDAVLTGRVHIRDGFRRWQERGGLFFLWQLGFQVFFLGSFAVVVGLPALLAWRAGLFRREHIGAMVLTIGVLVILFLMVITIGLVIFVLTKDFVVPIMALDTVGPIEGWRRLLAMMSAAKGSYAGYIGMKIVLAMAVGIIFGIASFLVILIPAIPIVIIAIAIVAGGAAAGLTWNAFTITAAVVAGAIVLAVIIFLIAIIHVPAVVFFQAYMLNFFGSRYDKLAAIVFPPPPPLPPLPPLPETGLA